MVNPQSRRRLIKTFTQVKRATWDLNRTAYLRNWLPCTDIYCNCIQKKIPEAAHSTEQIIWNIDCRTKLCIYFVEAILSSNENTAECQMKRARHNKSL